MNANVINELIEKVATPFYVFDIDTLKKRVNYLKEMMPGNVTLCYAMKANPFLVKEMGDVIDKYEVCSFGEYEICDVLDIPKEKLVISGVYKDEYSMRQILASKNVGVYTIESVNQFKLLDKLTRELKQNIKLILRLTSGNQFGMEEVEVEEIIKNRENYEYMEILGKIGRAHV